MTTETEKKIIEGAAHAINEAANAPETGIPDDPATFWDESGKKWYKTKPFFANMIGVAALALQAYAGYIISVEMQLAALVLINYALLELGRKK